MATAEGTANYTTDHAALAAYQNGVSNNHKIESNTAETIVRLFTLIRIYSDHMCMMLVLIS